MHWEWLELLNQKLKKNVVSPAKLIVFQKLTEKINFAVTLSSKNYGLAIKYWLQTVPIKIKIKILNSIKGFQTEAKTTSDLILALLPWLTLQGKFSWTCMFSNELSKIFSTSKGKTYIILNLTQANFWKIISCKIENFLELCLKLTEFELSGCNFIQGFVRLW